MGKNKLDKTIKDMLYDLDTPLDSNELWAGIQDKMGNKPDPKPIFPYKKFLGFGVLALLLLGSSYMIYNTLSTEEMDHSLSSSMEQGDIHNASANVTSRSSELSTLSSMTDSDSKSTNFTIEEGASSISKQTKKLEHQANQAAEQNNHFNQFEQQLKKNQKNNIPFSNALSNNTFEKTVDSKRTTSSDDLSTNIYGSDQNKSQDATTKSNSNNLNVETKTREEKARSNSIINAFDRLERKENVGVSFDRSIVDVCTFRDRIDCYDAWTKDNKFSLVPYIGVDFVTNDRIRTDSFANYLEERDNTMRFLEVIKVGALVKYNVTPNFYVKTGVQYDQIREVFESTTVETVSELVEGTIAYRITMDGDTVAVPGLVPQTTIVSTQWRKYNKYHAFNIPVILGYQAPIAKRWAYFGEVGAFYNVRFTYEGTLLDQNNQVVSGENFFLNNTGISLYGGFGISYNFNENLSAFTVGSYRYNLEPINNADFNPIKQNLGLAGIAFGIEYRL